MIRTSGQAMPRDQRLVGRLSEYTLEPDLPPDLLDITGPRLEILHSSRIQRYWGFMTNAPNPPPLPVPRNIMDPAHEGWLDLIMQEDWDTREEMIMEIYGLSRQDRIQVRDQFQYSVMNRGRRTHATPEQVQAFARRVILQLGDILASGGITLRADIYQTPRTDFLTACHFHMEQHPSPQEAREEYRGEPIISPSQELTREGLTGMLMPEAAPEIEKIETGNETLRVYWGSAFWRIACKTQYLWSEAQALHEADEIMSDHMEQDRQILQRQ